jgi:hypothetical protein
MNTSRVTAVLLVLCLFQLAATPTTKPATQPSGSMVQDQVHFTPPPNPWVQKEVKTPDTAYFQNEKGDCALQATWAPKDFDLNPTNVGQMSVAILKALKDGHVAKNQEMLIPPKIVKDKRFDIAIVERFKVTDSITEDEVHLYKEVGPRVMMVTASSVSTDEDLIAETHKIAEDFLVSCKFNRKAFKRNAN